MTFYEAALRVLEGEGKPLHINAITEKAIKDSLLSHVGKSPEEVMQSRLLAMARRRTDRKVIATAPQTYALADWGLPEDPAAYEPAVEEGQVRNGGPLLRGRERHPVPSAAKVRIAGRSERGRGREEDEDRRRRRKLPPLSEVAVEVLTAVGTPLAGVDLAAAARDRELVSEDLGAEALLNALREDNRRRTDSGRRPLFDFLPTGEVTLRAAPAEAVEIEAAVAYALGAPAAGREEYGPGAAKLIAQALEQRRQVLRGMRRRLSELDAAALEKSTQTLLELQGYVDVKVARRGREGPLLTARRREGLTELRCAIRLLRGSGEVGRHEVEELRRSVTQQGAHLGILLTAGEAGREARTDAAASQPLIFLVCGDALAEAFLEKRVGCAVTSVEVYDLDEDYFRRCRDRGREEREKRRESRGERGERGRRGRGERDAGPAEGRDRADAFVPQSLTEPSPDEQRARDAAALAERLVSTPDEDTVRRRAEEARARAAAHERIEAAELQARGGRAPSGSAA